MIRYGYENNMMTVIYFLSLYLLLKKKKKKKKLSDCFNVFSSISWNNLLYCEKET